MIYVIYMIYGMIYVVSLDMIYVIYMIYVNMIYVVSLDLLTVIYMIYLVSFHLLNMIYMIYMIPQGVLCEFREGPSKRFPALRAGCWIRFLCILPKRALK